MTGPSPHISIVTPSLNRAPYIEENIRSVLAQDYPHWEHIVVDGGSTDGTIDVLRRYPHLRWVSEPDRGVGHAVNKGCAVARGQVIGWLNAEDTYLPGAFATAIRELDRDRCVIVGHCEIVDEDTRTGIFHPRAYRDHQRLLEVWKGYAIPQPAVFFRRDVLDRCGGVDEQLDLGADYDLFLRFSQHYRFHEVDAVLATYRFHAASRKLAISDEECLRRLLAISRRYWGRRYSPAYWSHSWSSHVTLSPLRLQASRVWNRAVQAYGRGHYGTATGLLLLATTLFPPLAWHRGQYALFQAATRVVGFARTRRVAGLRALPRVIEGEIFDDGWVSDYAVVRCECVGPATYIAVEGEARLRHFSNGSLGLRVNVNGSDLGKHIVRRSGAFCAHFALPEPLRSASRFDVRIEPDHVFVPCEIGLSHDPRRLSFLFSRVRAGRD